MVVNGSKLDSIARGIHCVACRREGEYIQHLYSSSLAFDLLNALQYHDTKCKILLFHIFRAISIISSLCLLVDDSVMVFFQLLAFPTGCLIQQQAIIGETSLGAAGKKISRTNQLSFVELERDKALVEFTHSSLDNLLEGGILCAAHLNG